METNCKDCNRLIDECTCLEDTIDFPKYTRDQKRRAVQEIVRRLNEFDSTLKLVRQFDITKEDILEYTAARYVNSSKYTFDQAVEEATELRTRAIEAARDREEMLKEAHTASVARYMKSAGMVPHSSIKSYTDWA